MTMTLSINPPVGFEIDKEKSYPNSNEIVYKPIEKNLPEKWEDFKAINGCYISANSEIHQYNNTPFQVNINTWPTKELAEASLALCQLIRYRDAWNEGWQPDWKKDSECKFIIISYCGEIDFEVAINSNFVLAFKTKELRDKFYSTFKDLIETAKPLI